MASQATVAEQTDRSALDARRSERYRVQRLLWRHSEIDAVRSCGHHAINPEGLVGVKVTKTDAGSSRAGFSGLATCGSVWACPVCNSKIAARRAEELADAVRVWTGTGGRIVLVTLTMRHRRGQRLTELWDALSYGWSKATSGRGWQDDAERYGSEIEGRRRIPWVRAVEATHGEAGWHLHVHALVFLRGDADADALGASMFQRWRDALVRRGLQAPLARSGGLDVKEIQDADDAVAGYLAKATYEASKTSDERAGWELAGGAMKEAKRGNRAPFAILRSFVETGDLDDLGLWHEWERGSRGRRQLTWSKGLREQLRLAAEASDEEVAAEEMGGDTVQTIPADEWRAVRDRKADILRAAEVLPMDTLQAHPVSTWLIALDAFDPPGTR